MFLFFASIDLPALRDLSILNGRSLPYVYICILYIYYITKYHILFIELINSALKPLSKEMYRVIGDQPICSSNLCWARRI